MLFAGERAYCPEPLSVTIRLPTELLTVTLAESATAAFGRIVTLMVQLAPIARLVPQSFVCAKLVRFVPAIAMLVIDRDPTPGLERVIACAALAVPTSCGAKVSDVGETTACGAIPAPLSETMRLPITVVTVTLA